MVGPFVLDTSAAIAWCFEDEQTPASAALMARLESDHAVVPPLWYWEVSNALLMAERRKRIDAVSAERFLRLLERLPIETDERCVDEAFRDARTLARTHKLASYDAAYLELANRLSLPLATRDDALIKAAKAAGVVWLGA